MGQPRVNSIYLSEVTPEEIIKILQSLKMALLDMMG